MNKVFLSLGANLGNKAKNLSSAIELILNEIGTVEKVSGVYNSEPWGFEAEHCFYNMIVEVHTELNPQDLLRSCQNVEKTIGRIKTHDTFGYTSRVIDIDIVFYEDQIINEEHLIIPHYLMHERFFVLKPMNELAPNFVHPKLKKSIAELLKECDDHSEVNYSGDLSSLSFGSSKKLES